MTTLKERLDQPLTEFMTRRDAIKIYTTAYLFVTEDQVPGEITETILYAIALADKQARMDTW